jgi:hypothetical protein
MECRDSWLARLELAKSMIVNGKFFFKKLISETGNYQIGFLQECARESTARSPSSAQSTVRIIKLLGRETKPQKDDPGV